MKLCIASILKKLAVMIEEDNTPTDEEIERRRREQRARIMEKRGPGAPPGVRMPAADKPQVQEEKVEYLPAPEMRAPRRQLEHKKKWNKEDSTGLMKEYMEQYRADGNDVGNRYVKKPTV